MFCHLHVHNEFSVLDGYGTAEQYAKRASQMGFKYLALTNHGNIDGLLQHQEACLRHNIKPILGCEMYIVKNALVKEKGEKRFHIVLLIRNQRGYRNLNKLLTYANLKGFYYKPRIDYKVLLKHLDGLFFLTGCVGSFLNDEPDFIFKLPKRYTAIEVMPHRMREQRAHNDFCTALSMKTRIPLVATNDCHYVRAKDWEVQDVLLAIQSKKKMSDPDRFKFSIKNLHLRSYGQMRMAFERYHNLMESQIESALRNTINIAKYCCKFRIRTSAVRLPRVDIPDSMDDAEFLHQICIDELKRRDYGKGYADRLYEELKLINNKGYARYFLIVDDLLSWCRKERIMYGPGRGSVGGSLVAYLLGITSVDPLVHKTLFSRFINEDRIDYPDIDLDFEDNKRDRVRNYLENKYGADKVVGITTALRMKARNTIRDVSRAFDVPLKEVNGFCKAIDSVAFRQGRKESLQDSLETDEGVRFERKYPEVVKFALKLEGQVRAYGQHAAALILSPINLKRGSKGNLVERKNNLLINWDMNDAEKLGLLKIDILGLNTLTVLNEVNELSDDKINWSKINLEDEKIFNLINSGMTTGLFQVQTPFMTKLCSEVGIDNFNNLCDVIALGRPGPYDSGMYDSYKRRKKAGRWRKRIAAWEKITKDTYGVMIYQEQIMEALRRFANFSYSESDKVRKIIAKKSTVEKMRQYKESFIDGCIAEGILNKKQALNFWRGIEKHARYSFNRAHSVEYAMLCMWTAYCKLYYSEEFICASLTYMGNKSEQKKAMLEEAVRLGLKPTLPKWGISDGFKWIVKSKRLYAPFIEIKGIGRKTVTKFKTLSTSPSTKGFFKAEDVKPKVNSKVDKILNAVGAYDDNDYLLKEAQEYFDFN